MKALIQKLVGGLVRSGLLILIGWSGAEGALSDNEIAGVASAVGIILWGIYEKLSAYRTIKAAQALPAGVTDEQVKATAKYMPILPKAGE